MFKVNFIIIWQKNSTSSKLQVFSTSERKNMEKRKIESYLLTYGSRELVCSAAEVR